MLDLCTKIPYNIFMTITRIAPEGYEIANAYLQFGSIEATALNLRLPLASVAEALENVKVKDYLKAVYLDTGYRNRDKLGALLDRMIDQKVADAEESGMYTNKDLMELLTLAHKMRMDEIKAQEKSSTTVNVAAFGGDASYESLMRKLLP
jgi:hypothetical protein